MSRGQTLIEQLLARVAELEARPELSGPLHDLAARTLRLEQALPEDHMASNAASIGAAGEIIGAGKAAVLIAEKSAAIPKAAPEKLVLAVVNDTEGWWSAGLTRYIPQVKGFYLVSIFLQSTAVPAEASLIEAGPALNGAQLPGQAWGRFASLASAALSAFGMFLVKMNGTTDFLEPFAGNTVAGVTANARMDVALVGTA